MIDRENVIENLEQNIRWIEEIECHQFPGWGNVTMAMRDAVELLKEQEPVKAIEQVEWERDVALDQLRQIGKGLGEKMNDIVDMLNKHKKVKVVYSMMDTKCGNCGCYLDKTYSVCPKCGKRLDWNAGQG